MIVCVSLNNKILLFLAKNKQVQFPEGCDLAQTQLIEYHKNKSNHTILSLNTSNFFKVVHSLYMLL